MLAELDYVRSDMSLQAHRATGVALSVPGRACVRGFNKLERRKRRTLVRPPAAVAGGRWRERAMFGVGGRPQIGAGLHADLLRELAVGR